MLFRTSLLFFLNILFIIIFCFLKTCVSQIEINCLSPISYIYTYVGILQTCRTCTTRTRRIHNCGRLQKPLDIKAPFNFLFSALFDSHLFALCRFLRSVFYITPWWLGSSHSSGITGTLQHYISHCKYLIAFIVIFLVQRLFWWSRSLCELRVHTCT